MTGSFRIIMNSKWSPQIMEQPLVQQRRELSLPQIMSTTRLRSLTTTRWPLWWAMRSLGPLSSSSVQWMRMGMPSPTVLMVGLIYSFNHTNWYTVLMVWVTMVRLISSFGGTIDRENNIKSDNISLLWRSQKSCCSHILWILLLPLFKHSTTILSNGILS